MPPSTLTKQNKELRWELLSLFPTVSPKIVSEAARSGDFLQAVDSIVATTGCPPPDPCEIAVAVEKLEPRIPALAPAEPTIASQFGQSTHEEPNTDTPHGFLLSVCTPSIRHDQFEKWEEDARATVENEILDEIRSKADLEEIEEASAALRSCPLPGRRRSPTPEPAVLKSADGWEIKCVVEKMPCQSLRSPMVQMSDPGRIVMNQVGVDNTAAYAAICFEQMLKREQELDGTFFPFYHSYNGASLLYEVQSEIARFAYDLKDNFAPLPRVLSHTFSGVSLGQLKESFKDMKGQDHDPRFRALAISATPTLFSATSEAPPLHCFRHGYGCGDLSFRGLLVTLLSEVYGAGDMETLADELADVANHFGLHGHLYHSQGHARRGGQGRMGGQMLQIFIHRSEVQKLVYHSHAFGVPVDGTTSVLSWLEQHVTAGKNPLALDGQVRILVHPEVFVDESRGRIFHYAGDWEFHGGDADMKDSRAAFVLALRKVLSPALRRNHQSVVMKRLRRADSAVRLAADGPCNAATRKLGKTDVCDAHELNKNRATKKGVRKKR